MELSEEAKVEKGSSARNNGGRSPTSRGLGSGRANLVSLLFLVRGNGRGPRWRRG